MKQYQHLLEKKELDKVCQEKNCSDNAVAENFFVILKS